MNIGTALSKPFSNITRLVVGIVLSIIPIVNILTIPGYLLRVANKTMNNDNSLPEFSNFGELVVNSLKAIVVGIVYAIIFMVVSIILALIPVVGPLLAFIWLIVFFFIAASAMMALAKTGSISDALSVPAVAKNAATGPFIIAIIVGAVISAVIMGVVLGIVLAITGAALIPVLMTMGTSNMANPMALSGVIGAIIGASIVAGIVGAIVGYILNVFCVSLVAESYPAAAAPAAKVAQ